MIIRDIGNLEDPHPEEMAQILSAIGDEWCKYEITVHTTGKLLTEFEKQLFAMVLVAWLARNTWRSKPRKQYVGWELVPEAEAIFRKMLIAINLWKRTDIKIGDDLDKVLNQIAVYERLGEGFNGA